MLLLTPTGCNVKLPLLCLLLLLLLLLLLRAKDSRDAHNRNISVWQCFQCVISECSYPQTNNVISGAAPLSKIVCLAIEFLFLQMNFTKRNVSKTQHNYKRMHFHISDVLLEIVLFGKIVNQNISVWQCCQCVISESRCPLKSDHFWNLPAVQRWCVLRRSFCLNS